MCPNTRINGLINLGHRHIGGISDWPNFNMSTYHGDEMTITILT